MFDFKGKTIEVSGIVKLDDEQKEYDRHRLLRPDRHGRRSRRAPTDSRRERGVAVASGESG